ncbi:MAG: iron transporter permease [Alphaproteobacteria bacterium]|nr:iron transporter permease [Alphaproteobacteria bacterium]
MVALDTQSHRSRPRVAFRLEGWAVFALAIALLVLAPVLAVVHPLITADKALWQHLVDTVLARYLVNTLVLMLGVGFFTFVLGVAAAWLVTMCRFPGVRLFEWALLLPLAMPAYVVAYAYTGLLDFAGPVQSFLRTALDLRPGSYGFPSIRNTPGAVAVLSLVLYPYVYLTSRASFLDQSVCVLEVSRTLGRTGWGSFTQVALPLARPAIIGGLALALMETLNEFGAVQFFGVDTFSTGIFRAWFGFGDYRAAAQLAAAMMLVVAILLLIERFSRGKGRIEHSSRRYSRLKPYVLSGGAAAAAALFCAALVGLGFLIPALTLLGGALEHLEALGQAEFYYDVWHSVSLAALAACVAVLIALGIAYAERLQPSPPVRAAARTAGLGYAIPGAVLAVGILLPLTALDHGIDALARLSFGVSTGLLLTGSAAALLGAYTIRFLAVALNTVEAGMARITPSMESAARTLGAPPSRTLRLVHAPMMAGSLFTAAILVFVDVMKELPATYIMRPFDYDTLAVRAYQYAADERLSQAALPSLAIVVFALAPVLLLSRAIARSRPGSTSDVVAGIAPRLEAA